MRHLEYFDEQGTCRYGTQNSRPGQLTQEMTKVFASNDDNKGRRAQWYVKKEFEQ